MSDELLVLRGVPGARHNPIDNERLDCYIVIRVLKRAHAYMVRTTVLHSAGRCAAARPDIACTSLGPVLGSVSLHVSGPNRRVAP